MMAQSRSEARGLILHHQTPFQTVPKYPYLQPQNNEDDAVAQSSNFVITPFRLQQLDYQKALEQYLRKYEPI